MMRLALPFVLVSLSLAPLQAQIVASEVRSSTISVNAQRFTPLDAERATFYAVMEGSGETALLALARADSAQAAVMRAVRGVGRGVEVAAPLPMGPSGMERRFAPPGQAPTQKTHRNLLRVTVTDMSQLARTMAVAIDAGASSVSNLRFESSKADSARRSQIAAAIADAQREAEAIARALGARLDGVLDVNTQITDRFFPNSSFSNDIGLMQSPVNPDVTISTMVTVRFRFVKAP